MLCHLRLVVLKLESIELSMLHTKDTAAHLERLEQMLAGWIYFALIHHGMVREVGETIVRIMFVIK